MVVAPRLLITDRSRLIPMPTLLLMSTVPPHAAIESVELAPALIPMLPLLEKVPAPPMVTCDVLRTRPVPWLLTLDTNVSVTSVLEYTSMPSLELEGLVTTIP